MNQGENIVGNLNLLSAKLQKLIADYKKVREELAQSKESNKQLRIQLDHQNEELKNFQNQEKISKIVSSLAGSTQNSPELKLKINEYIKEIDKCIAHLSE